MLEHLINYETSRRVRRAASRLGVNVRLAANSRPCDFRQQPEIDPVAAIYEAGTRPVILRVPLGQCTFGVQLAFRCLANGRSPQVQTLIGYANGQCETYQGSALERFCDSFTPKSAAELMGLSDPSYLDLDVLPPSAALLPWQPQTPTQAIRSLQRSIASEARQHRAGRMSAGDILFGHVSPSQGKLEFRRLVSVYKSIQLHGLVVDREGFNNVSAVCLVSDRNVKGPTYFILGGHHRAAAATALGHNYIDLQIRQEGLGGVIRRSDAQYWPTVRNGYLNEAEATELFDRLVAGKPSKLL